MCLNPEEERTCGCGGHGHLEQYSSATGVVSNYLAECRRQASSPSAHRPSDSKDVFQACREGDKLALAAADTMADYLGRALALIANVVDPGCSSSAAARPLRPMSTSTRFASTSSSTRSPPRARRPSRSLRSETTPSSVPPT